MGTKTSTDSGSPHKRENTPGGKGMTQNATCTIYRASAGSGKTYTIVEQYLSLLLEAFDDHKTLEERLRSILAITFTNKAASEMKERILLALQKLSRRDTTLYPTLWNAYPDLDRRAAEILHFILHHYSLFTITTIDSFILRLAQSVAFELGLPLRFDVVLDNTDLFEEIISDILDEFEKDPDITALLLDMITSAMDTKPSSIEKSLFSTARTLYKEANYLALYPVLTHHDFRRQGRFYTHVIETLKRLSEKVKQTAQGVLESMREYGIQREDLPYGGSGNLSFFERFLKEEYDDINHESPRLEKWTTRNTPQEKKHRLEAWEEKVVRPALDDLRIQTSPPKENTGLLFSVYRALQDHLHTIALMNIFQQYLEKKIRHDRRIPIEEFGRRLHMSLSREIIPYVYLRLGETYRYFFIDEFQDTSRLQWYTLEPLLEEARANNGHVYLVGDPKQAIYRWRNGDVTIMLDLLTQSEHSPGIETRTLEANYRSHTTIVNFVNTFFSALTDQLKDTDLPLFIQSYTDLVQKPQKNDEGYVEFTFEVQTDTAEEDESPDDPETPEASCAAWLAWCEEKIRLAHEEKAYAYRDIAVLVRKNTQASMVARFLLDKNIPVISEGALFLSHSPAVRRVIATLGLLLHPSDPNTLLTFLHLVSDTPLESDTLRHFFQDLSGATSFDHLLDLCHHYADHEAFRLMQTILSQRDTLLLRSLPDLVEEIIRTLPTTTAETPPHHTFLSKLLDIVRNFSLKTSGSIADFLETWHHSLAHTASIDPDESADAVRIMTIHKSKGLEFPVVLCPLLDEKTQSDRTIIAPIPTLRQHPLPLPEHDDTQTFFWLYNAKKNLSRLPDAGVTYRQEKDLAFLDSINLLYVAFTRARHVLLSYVALPPQANTSFSADTWKHALPPITSDTRIGLVILSLLKDRQFTFLSDTSITTSEGSWPSVQPSPPSPSPHQTLSLFPSSPWQDKLRVRRHEAEIHLLFHDKQKLHIEEGILIHELLSYVRTEEDIEQVVQTYREKLPGEFSSDQYQNITAILREIWNLFVQNGWTRDFTIHNEENILTPIGLIRPDKIFLSRDKKRAIVVDYKSGLQTREKDPATIIATYQEQLKKYCDAIARMGYQTTEGYVLFVNTKQLHKVV